jgi:hypothetical protein
MKIKVGNIWYLTSPEEGITIRSVTNDGWVNYIWNDDALEGNESLRELMNILRLGDWKLDDSSVINSILRKYEETNICG